MESEDASTNSDEEIKEEKIKFLYKFVEGVSYSSFGMDVAKMAGVSEQVLIKARFVSD